MNSSFSPLRMITVGHVDHGKSTLLGRLLYDTNALSQEQLIALQSANQKEEKAMEFSFLLDAFAEEQSEHITIETTQMPLRTAAHDYLLIDAPGHEEFLKNMVTGATTADAALLIVDAKSGIKKQTRRHLQLLSLLGIKQIVAVLNKMDLINYNAAAFQKRRLQLEKLFEEFHLPAPAIVPVAALFGENIVTPSSKMSWHHGPTLLEQLSHFKKPLPPSAGPLRFVLQDVYHFQKSPLFVGRIESGTLHVGEEIIFSPSGTKAHVHSFEEWNAPTARKTASAGASVAITLKESSPQLQRGDIASHLATPPLQGSEIGAHFFWFDLEPLQQNEKIKLHLGTQHVEGVLATIIDLNDIMTLESSFKEPTEIAPYHIAHVIFCLQHPLAYDLYDHVEPTGRFVIERKNRIGGGGIIKFLSKLASDNEALDGASTSTTTQFAAEVEIRKKSILKNENFSSKNS